VDVNVILVALASTQPQLSSLQMELSRVIEASAVTALASLQFLEQVHIPLQIIISNRVIYFSESGFVLGDAESSPPRRRPHKKWYV